MRESSLSRKEKWMVCSSASLGSLIRTSRSESSTACLWTRLLGLLTSTVPGRKERIGVLVILTTLLRILTRRERSLEVHEPRTSSIDHLFIPCTFVTNRFDNKMFKETRISAPHMNPTTFFESQILTIRRWQSKVISRTGVCSSGNYAKVIAKRPSF